MKKPDKSINTRNISQSTGLNDVSGLSKDLSSRLELMHSMFRIISDETQSVEQQIDKVLEIGSKLFEEDIGIVSRIEGNSYIVKNVYPPNGDIKPNQRFELQNTFCAITLQSNKPLGIDDVMKSLWSTHPCIHTGLKSYIGVPLVVNGVRFGTLNFSSTVPKSSQFRKMDLEFVRTLGQWMGTVIQRTELINQLQKETVQDSLTELMNRRGVLNVLDRYAHRPSAKDSSFSILFIDLDNFKSINDTHGHLMGDQLLHQVARRLENIKRPMDTIGRFGGDEFIAVLEDVNVEQALLIARRIVDIIESPFKLDSSEIRISASIGLAMATDGHELEELLDMADTAMYEAKKSGKRISVIHK
jgi:diguanylate cyclase (GGDEF)-like protein